MGDWEDESRRMVSVRVPVSLWRLVRVRAAEEGESVQAVVERALWVAVEPPGGDPVSGYTAKDVPRETVGDV